MTIKLICIDMDGTLYDHNRCIQKETLQELSAAQKEGIHIAVITGRPLNYIMAYQKQAGYRWIMAGSNGAAISIYGKQQFYPIDLKDAVHMAEYVQRFSLTIFMKSLHYIYTNSKDPSMFHYDEMTADLQNYQMHTCVRSDIKKAVSSCNEDLLKVIVIGDDIKGVSACRQEFHRSCTVSTFSSDPHHFELTSSKADKGKAIAAICNELHLKQEEVACIGDSDNDRPMFEASGFRIAMENAQEDIKKLSDYVTDTNDQNGVGKAINYLRSINWNPESNK